MTNDDQGSDATRAKGKVKEVAGRLAGDREAEAKGKVEAEKGEAASDREKEEATEQVRAEHGDTGRPSNGDASGG